MKKILSLIMVLLISQIVFSNMGSPIIPGSMSASPFTSKYVNILDESILIILNKEITGTKFIIEYHINSEKEGLQIPLLFYAFDFKDDFKVWIDGKELKLKDIPSEFEKIKNVFFNDFDYFFRDTTGTDMENIVQDTIQTGFYVNTNDLKYFETDITKGQHTIKVEYSVKEWIDRSDWINKYSIRYALSPAKYWKSFGSLKITIDATAASNKITLNLNAPDNGSLDSIASWTFHEIPVEILHIDFFPKVNRFTNVIIGFGPGGLSLVVFIILIVLHVLYLLNYRRRNPDKRFSWVMISGSFLVPALAIIFYLISFPLIDFIIGDSASERHGYYFLMVFAYPFILPVYLVIMWLTDRLYKKQLVRKDAVQV